MIDSVSCWTRSICYSHPGFVSGNASATHFIHFLLFPGQQDIERGYKSNGVIDTVLNVCKIVLTSAYNENSFDISVVAKRFARFCSQNWLQKKFSDMACNVPWSLRSTLRCLIPSECAEKFPDIQMSGTCVLCLFCDPTFYVRNLFQGKIGQVLQVSMSESIAVQINLFSDPLNKIQAVNTADNFFSFHCSCLNNSSYAIERSGMLSIVFETSTFLL